MCMRSRMAAGHWKKNGTKCGSLSRTACSTASTKCPRVRVAWTAIFFSTPRRLIRNGKNIAVANNSIGRTMSTLGVILTGRKLGDRQFDVKMLFQQGAWKVDEVKFGD